MHRSKLGQILVDCQVEDMAAAVRFWSGALGLAPDPRDLPTDRYFALLGPAGGLRVLLQRVEWPSSYHLDIEADDVEAEVRRLEALGAVRKRKVDSWWVMRAPTGHDFCVICPQSEGSVESARSWED
jgi:hypothetical protein